MTQMTTMGIGFTGSQKGATMEQRRGFDWVVAEWLPAFVKEEPFNFHHGDCIGWDTLAHEIIATNFPYQVTTYAHPWNGPDTKRAFCKSDIVGHPMPPLDRNKIIVELAANALIACPPTNNEILRSGTWATIRYAWKKKRRIMIVRPDGLIDLFFQSVLAQHVLADEERNQFNEVDW
jgi:hypothetical protein